MSDQLKKKPLKGNPFVNLNKDQYEVLALKIAVLKVVHLIPVVIYIGIDLLIRLQRG